MNAAKTAEKEMEEKRMQEIEARLNDHNYFMTEKADEAEVRLRVRDVLLSY